MSGPKPHLLAALARAVAEAAARCVGATPAQTQSHVRTFGPHFGDMLNGVARQTVHLAARAGAWQVKGYERGTPGPALDAAAVLALRERVQRQRDERALMLAADDEALRVIDAEARIYDAATIAEAADALSDGPAGHGTHYDGSWTRSDLDGYGSAVVDACDAILRRRAAEAPTGAGRVTLPADVAADGAVTVRVPGDAK